MTLRKEDSNVANGAVTPDGGLRYLASYGLFDSDAFTRALVNGLRVRKG